MPPVSMVAVPAPARLTLAQRALQLARSRPIGVIATAENRCPRTHCRGYLVFRDAAFGRVVAACPRCERRTAGLCQNCPAPVAGKVGAATRCAACARKAAAAAVARSRARTAQYGAERRDRVAARVTTHVRPTCERCRQPIPYTGVGRPPRRHATCRRPARALARA